MKRLRSAQAFLLITLFSLSAVGLQRAPAQRRTAPQPRAGTPAANRTETPAAGAEATQARFDQLRRVGFEALYNLDYEGARRRFREIAALFPDHPAGPHFLATTLWLQTLNESRRLQAGIYTTDSFYAGGEDNADPRTVAQFRELTQQAKRLAEERLRRTPRDPEALYFLGAVEGLRAAFAGAVERRFTSALREGSDAVDRHRDVIRIDPTYHDAEVTIGLYDYIVGGLPLPIRILANIGGIRGSKRRGIETLQRVARQGRWAQDDAKVMLIAILKRERRYEEALTFARELAAKYPRNYIFRIEAADALAWQATTLRPNDAARAEQAEREAFAILDALLRERGALRGVTPRERALDLIHSRYGDVLVVAGQPGRATQQYLAAANTNGAEESLATMARLRAAQAYDLAGQRQEAVALYEAVLARPNVYDSHETARRGLREPFRRPGGSNQSAASER